MNKDFQHPPLTRALSCHFDDSQIEQVWDDFLLWFWFAFFWWLVMLITFHVSMAIWMSYLENVPSAPLPTWLKIWFDFLRCSGVSNSLRLHVFPGFYSPVRLLCLWFYRQEYWVAFHSFIQGNFLIQVSNWHLLLWQADYLPKAPHWCPRCCTYFSFNISNMK